MNQISQTQQLDMMSMMLLIRRFELRMQDNFKKRTRAGEIVGAIHSYEGQEAIAVGISALLREDDYVFSTHRGHGHALAKGADLNKVTAELLGKATGYCRGRGGSMHLFDASIGLMGGNGVVGGGLPLALGAGYSAINRGTDQITVAYFGEGAVSQGSFHESMNMASLLKYPIIYVCENNLYAATVHVKDQYPVKDVADRAAGYGMDGHVVDGNDVLAVHKATSQAITKARAGQGPTLLECKTYRHRPHCMVIPEHRNREELDQWKEGDPIKRFEQHLLESGDVTQTQLDDLAMRIEQRLDEALDFADQSPTPQPQTLLQEFWAT